MPAVLGGLVLVASLVSFTSIVIYMAYSDELTHLDGHEHHLQDRIRHLFARHGEAEQRGGAAAPPDLAASIYDTYSEKASNQENSNVAAAVQTAAMPLEVPVAPQIVEQAVAKKQAPAALAAVVGLQRRSATASGVEQPKNRIEWRKHESRSCQNYAEEPVTQRDLARSKEACLRVDACVAIECGRGSEHDCTLRAIANLVPYDASDCYEQLEVNQNGVVVSTRVHPEYNNLLKQYPFQQVATQTGNQVNILLVRSQMSREQIELYKKYKDEILFLGISSMNDYPLNEEVDYLGMFPGFLHMMHNPEKHFPPHVKTLLMSQSDFNLPQAPARDYSVPKKYDFTYSASDCDVAQDGAGWCGWSKNWSFVKSALGMMCGEMKLTGVLVATKDKANRRAYTIPESCKGRMIQTTYLAQQGDYFNYLKQSRFAFLPQIHDASPRVSTQALAFDVPILMNYYIQGGWKYVSDQTGEFFHDLSDFRQALDKILKGADTPHRYEPRKWVLDNYDTQNSGKKLLNFVLEHFSDRVKLPKGTKLLSI